MAGIENEQNPQEQQELDADLQEYTQAEEDYSARFGRSLTLDLMTLVNSQSLQAELQQNQELAGFIQNEADKYVGIAQEYMQTFLEEETPSPMGETSPKEHPVTCRFHICYYRDPGCGKPGYALKKRIPEIRNKS